MSCESNNIPPLKTEAGSLLYIQKYILQLKERLYQNNLEK